MINFSINKTAFLNNLRITKQAISTKVAIPTLSKIKIDVSTEGITLTGSNGQISIENFLSKDDENVQLRKTVHNQQQEIVSLNTELSLYKSVFKQFETLFPDLKETLEGSNSQDLLGKIQQLVSEQQNNVKNLQSYFEEGAKQKAIKDGFKKRL